MPSGAPLVCVMSARSRQDQGERGAGHVQGERGTHRRVKWALQVIRLWLASVAMYGHRAGKYLQLPSEPKEGGRWRMRRK